MVRINHDPVRGLPYYTVDDDSARVYYLPTVQGAKRAAKRRATSMEATLVVIRSGTDYVYTPDDYPSFEASVPNEDATLVTQGSSSDPEVTLGAGGSEWQDRGVQCSLAAH